MMMNFLLIFKGSIIEGACLSRIFHLGHQSLELEADVMYIVGCIDEKISQEIFEVEFSFFVNICLYFLFSVSIFDFCKLNFY